MLRSEISVRKATSQDLPRVFEIEIRSFSEPFPLNLFEELLRTWPDTFLVAIDKWGIAGYVVASIEKSVGHVLSIAVDLDKRRARIGTILVNKLVKILGAMKIPLLRLEVGRSNAAGRAFYSSLGFVETGVLENYYANDEDAIVMLLKHSESNMK